jgi:hypothetical protein
VPLRPRRPPALFHSCAVCASALTPWPAPAPSA